MPGLEPSDWLSVDERRRSEAHQGHHKKKEAGTGVASASDTRLRMTGATRRSKRKGRTLPWRLQRQQSPELPVSRTGGKSSRVLVWLDFYRAQDGSEVSRLPGEHTAP